MRQLFLMILITVFIFSCNKPEPEETALQDSADCLLIKITNSDVIYDSTILIYNNARQLIRFSPHGQTDTFCYDSSNRLTSSAYSGGPMITPNQRRTDYIYTNGVLTRTNYVGVLRAGVESLSTYSLYTFDSDARLASVKQVGLEPYTNTHTTRYVYDNNDNLLKIFKKENNNSAEYLSTEFLDYDSCLNPFYKLPWEFDYDLFNYNSDRLSRHNPRRVKTYSGYIIIGGVLQTSLYSDLIYAYDYDRFKKVTIRRTFNGGSPGPSISTDHFTYSACQ